MREDSKGRIAKKLELHVNAQIFGQYKGRIIGIPIESAITHLRKFKTKGENHYAWYAFPMSELETFDLSFNTKEFSLDEECAAAYFKDDSPTLDNWLEMMLTLESLMNDLALDDILGSDHVKAISSFCLAFSTFTSAKEQGDYGKLRSFFVGVPHLVKASGIELELPHSKSEKVLEAADGYAAALSVSEDDYAAALSVSEDDYAAALRLSKAEYIESGKEYDADKVNIYCSKVVYENKRDSLILSPIFSEQRVQQFHDVVAAGLDDPYAGAGFSMEASLNAAIANLEKSESGTKLLVPIRVGEGDYGGHYNLAILQKNEDETIKCKLYDPFYGIINEDKIDETMPHFYLIISSNNVAIDTDRRGYQALQKKGTYDCGPIICALVENIAKNAPYDAVDFTATSDLAEYVDGRDVLRGMQESLIVSAQEEAEMLNAKLIEYINGKRDEGRNIVDEMNIKNEAGTILVNGKVLRDLDYSILQELKEIVKVAEEMSAGQERASSADTLGVGEARVAPPLLPDESKSYDLAEQITGLTLVMQALIEERAQARSNKEKKENCRWPVYISRDISKTKKALEEALKTFKQEDWLDEKSEKLVEHAENVITASITHRGLAI